MMAKIGKIKIICTTCNGTGTVKWGAVDGQGVEQQCPTCKGKGKIKFADMYDLNEED